MYIRSVTIIGGWLTSLTGRPEDSVRAVPTPCYTELYDEYCRAIGIESISDNTRDDNFQAMISERRSNDPRRVREEKARQSPWKGTRVIEYLVLKANEAVEEEKKRHLESKGSSEQVTIGMGGLLVCYNKQQTTNNKQQTTNNKQLNR